MANACATVAEIIVIGGPAYEPPTVPIPVMDFYADLACDIVGDCYGDRKSQAHTFLTLHFIDMANGAIAPAGSVTGRRINQIQTNYSSGTPIDAGILGLTKWGKLLAQLDQYRIQWPVLGRTFVPGAKGGGCGC